MKYYIDGFVNGKNPSPFGGGYSIVDENGELVEIEYIEKSGFTNNEAEVLGLYNALGYATSGDIISTDSQNNLYWLCGGKSKSRPDLNDVLEKSKGLLKNSNVTIVWEPREYNLAGIYNEFGVVSQEEIENSKNHMQEVPREIRNTLEKINLFSKQGNFQGYIHISKKKSKKKKFVNNKQKYLL